VRPAISFEARVLSVCDYQRSEDEDLLEGSEEQAETSHKRRRFDEAALERKRELRLWNEQRRVIISYTTTTAAEMIALHLSIIRLLLSVGWEMSISQDAVMLCGWGLKVDMAHSTCALSLWVAGKIV